ncbi:hypothetical protein THASP1DRAFT_27932 [Thamnocephalis sphaerospora]|uniref:Ubiquitin carboxyl-terminal hydrolase n=1 Tax=Thamnocephalis sphaerospora TaxID=78915 RepID=A0A4P9XVH9_9FUNG|nr:hypothetical protein THASP1DRAFT_27932 [Thamnocephalis sphaerospora]|eukprot:RKP10294.1 hypothetical protein THASP1DRAFT_27932 [Thamnocephalis sphaerospora]
MSATPTTTAANNEAVFWHPLESNPEAMNQFAHTLGLSQAWAYADILTLEDELLCMVPSPCHAVLLLFPITDNYEAFCREESERIARDGQRISPNIYYMRQTIRNACGTYAVLHSLANNQDRVGLDAGPLKEFFETTSSLSPEERSERLKHTRAIAEAHIQSAHIGQTATPEANAALDLHFICFVERDGDLYELDGRKTQPINHGPCTDLLKGAAKVVRDFMARDPDQVQFTLMALASNETD